VHIFIFGIRSKNLTKYSKGVRVILSISIINNYYEVIKQRGHTREVNSLKNTVEQELSKVLVRLENPLIGRFTQPMVLFE